MRCFQIITVTLCTLALAGCTQVPVDSKKQRVDQAKPAKTPTPAEVARLLEPNVLGVKCFYNNFNPWIRKEAESRICGVVIGAMYLVGPNEKGVFGDGIIRPKLYKAQLDEQGKRQWILVKEWSYSVEQAMSYRAKRPKVYGWGYRFALNWGDIDLTRRDIMLTVGFERSDGAMVGPSKKEFRVPP